MIVFFEGIVMCFILLLYCVVGIRNGAVGLVCLYEKDVQERVVELGLFDRFFIDWYWVGRTKAWFIPGTEDLKPYIPVKVLVRKWIGTVVVYPLLALLMAKIMTFIG